MQITNYHEARAYLESFIQIPSEIDKNALQSLERIEIFLKLLNNPQKKFRSIQISGTAGKGSTSYLISRMLTNAGYKTGLTTSPHLEKLNERIQINNTAISDAAYIRLLNTIIPVIEKMKTQPLGAPSYLEILIALAFSFFAQENIDIAVVEVGLEGKYDSTNTLSPLLAVITNIHLDHTELLGNTVEQIAKEAVSIIKTRGQITIIGNMKASVLAIIKKRCEETKGSLRILGKTFHFHVLSIDRKGSVFNFTAGDVKFTKLQLSLVGSYQIENAALAIDTVLQLKKNGITVSEEVIRSALQSAHFPGRFERILYQGQEIVMDGAHNPVKMQSFITAFKHCYSGRNKIFITTFKKGKIVTDMLQEIALEADMIILTEFHSTLDERKNASMDVETLEAIGAKIPNSKSTALYTTRSVHEALSLGFSLRNDVKGILIVTGSLYLVGEMRELLMKNSS